VSEIDVRLSQRNRQTVPDSWARDRETPVAESTACPRKSEHVGISRAELAASGVGDRLAVVDQVRWSLTAQRRVHEGRQLIVNSLATIVRDGESGDEGHDRLVCMRVR